MRNLFRFIAKYSFVLLFLCFESFALYLLISNNSYHHAKFINSSNVVSGYFYKKTYSIKQYLNLRFINENLGNENTYLHNKALWAFREMHAKSFNLSDSVFHQVYKVYAATVINNSVNRPNNFLTLDKGSTSGIKSEMGVFGPTGLVGIVKNVSPHFSSVISLLNTEIKISGMIAKNGYYGSLHWEGIDFRYATLSEIPNHVDIIIGDSIITSGYSAIFPKGIFIGYVEDFNKVEGNSFYEIKVKLTTDFKNISHVYVISNTLQAEQKALESKLNYGQGDN